MKKILAVIAAGALVISALTACTGSSSTESSAAETTTEAGTVESDEEEETEAATEAVKGAELTTVAEGNDSVYVREKGKLVVGITDFEPMDYQDEDGGWTGFDADMAALFAESLGVDVEFIEIDWDNKILELDGLTVDCIWNGMTLTDEVLTSMECSSAYMNNAQVVVVPADKADDYQDIESISDLVFAVEAGSAGEAVISEMGFSCTPVNTQSGALMEVEAGTSDAAVIDALMASAMTGEGTGYADLTYTIGLNDEEYGVGFRKGSDLALMLDEFFEQSYADGTMQECAEKYGVQAALIGR